MPLAILPVFAVLIFVRVEVVKKKHRRTGTSFSVAEGAVNGLICHDNLYTTVQ